jgi:phosphoglucomutase
MAVHPEAGKPAPASVLADIKALLDAYYNVKPEGENPAQGVIFGTSGHRGSSLNGTFTETHILAITQAVCDYRIQAGISGPLFLGMDTHALSLPAHRTALEVLSANKVKTRVHRDNLVTPTPVISFSVLEFNFSKDKALADGIVITPSHNPPEDGGFKYNPPHGGPADSKVTAWIEDRANNLIRSGLSGVKRMPHERALRSGNIDFWDYVTPYLRALPEVLDMRLISSAGLSLCADALGGSSSPFWEPLGEMYKLKLKVVNSVNDPQFSFMTLDKDGKIRMDCSSPWAMAGLLEHKNEFDLCFGNDPDADRHGIVTPEGLMNPNHYLSVCVDYLFRNRPGWKAGARAGKTVVTSSMLDRAAAGVKRRIYEVPVGFKWFVNPLLNGACAFGGEESAGASFLRMQGRPWSTDKDGLLLDLLAAEITARTGRNPAELYRVLSGEYGVAYYERQDAPADNARKERLGKLSPSDIRASTLAGDAITGIFTHAPGNNEPIGGLKVNTANGWFAARPSGTEDVYKIYAESFISREHLSALQDEAKKLVTEIFASC